MKTEAQGSPCLMGMCDKRCLCCGKTVYNDCNVTNNYYMSAEEMLRKDDFDKEPQTASFHTERFTTSTRRSAPEAPVDGNARKEIIRYVLKVRSHLDKKWMSRFEKDWNAILDLQVVQDSIYKVGKQKGTNFNRNLVANILYYMEHQGVFGDHYNATLMATLLEDSGAHSVRAELRKDPPPAIVSRLDRHFE